MTKMTLAQGTAFLELAQDMGVTRRQFHALEKAGVFRLLFSVNPETVDVDVLKNVYGIKEPYRFCTPAPESNLLKLSRPTHLSLPFAAESVSPCIDYGEQNTEIYKSLEREFLEYRIRTPRTYSEILRGMRSGGLRPSTAGELLTFLAKYPDEPPPQYPLVALASRFTPWDEYYCGSYLCVVGEHGFRALKLVSVGRSNMEAERFKFPKNFRFFATPLESSGE